MRLSYVRVIALCSALVLGAVGAARAADFSVVLDHARMVKLPDRVTTVVVGNPGIADASVQSGGWMVVTGKGYGVTNVVALDRSGIVLLEKTIQVQGPEDVVVVYRGPERETLSCSPDCSRRLTLGDAPTVFTPTAAQINVRNGLAVSSAQSR